MVVLNTRQLDWAIDNPRSVAIELKSEKILNKGFKGITIEMCYSLGKGIFTLPEAIDNLEFRLKENFKDNKINRNKRLIYKKILIDFYDFITDVGLVCSKNFTRVNVLVSQQRKIGGNSCAIFQYANENKYCGVIVVEDEFEYSNSLRVQVERYTIAKRMNIDNLEQIDIYLFRLADCSYELLPTKILKFDDVLENSVRIFEKVERELADLGKTA